VGSDGYTLGSSPKVARLKSQNTAIAPYRNDELNRSLESIKFTKKALTLNVVKMVIAVMNSPKERVLSPSTIDRYLRWLKADFLPYVNQLKDFATANDDLALFNSDYLSWLKTEKESGNQVASVWNKLRRFAKKFCEDRGNAEYLTAQILDIRERKSLSTNYNSIKTLSSLYPHLKLEDDLALLNGCQEFVIWYLNEMNSVRQYILDNLPSRLKKYYKRIKNSKKVYASREENFSIGITSKILPKGEHVDTPDFTEITDMIKLVHTYPSPVIQEMMFVELLGIKTFLKFYVDDKRLFNIDEINEFVSNFWTGKQNAPAHLRGERDELKVEYSGSIESLSRKQLAAITFPTLSFPVTPSKQEKIAMEWLLAASRSQTSGIEALTYEKNILHDPVKKTIQIVQERKHRQRKSMKDGFKQGHDSPIYHNDNHYYTLNNWVELIAHAGDYVADHDGMFIPNMLRHERSISYRKSEYFLWLASIEGSYTNTAIKEFIKGNENEKGVLDFLRLLYENQTESRTVVERINERRHAAHKARAAEKTLKKQKHKTPQDRISIRSIAQTRAVIDMRPKQNLSLVGHNLKTHQNTYIDRSESKYVQSDSAYWAAEIGNAFIKEALKLYGDKAYQQSLDWLADAKLISIKDARDTLKIKDITDEDDIEFIQHVINQAEAEGFVVDLSGILKSKEQTIVLLTPWTCALIMANATQLKNQFKDTEITTNQKAFNAISQVIYLELLLERFPKGMKKKARALLEEYEIPFKEKLA